MKRTQEWSSSGARFRLKIKLASYSSWIRKMYPSVKATFWLRNLTIIENKEGKLSSFRSGSKDEVVKAAFTTHAFYFLSETSCDHSQFT
jgi:hypothetical protein